MFPVQLARIVVVEADTQEYLLCTAQDAKIAISTIIGTERPGDLLTWKEKEESAQADGLFVSGITSFTFSLHALDLRQFFVEGHGRHVMYNPKTRELISSSEFYIIDDGPHWVKELRQGAVTLRLLQRTVREFSRREQRSAHESILFIRVFIKQLPEYGRSVYSIDYGAAHDLGILDVAPPLPDIPGKFVSPSVVRPSVDSRRTSIRRIGTFHFFGPADGRKMFDLDDYDLWLKNDYASHMKRDPEPQSPAARFEWGPRPACWRGDHDANR